MATKRKAAPSLKPHPELDHQLLGAAVNIVETQANIQREWQRYFTQPFPGWSHDALAGVAAYAGLPASDVEHESPFIIYRKAIAQKKPKASAKSKVGRKKGKTLKIQLIEGAFRNGANVDDVCDRFTISAENARQIKSRMIPKS
jgi:hypothetical protein